MRNTVKWFGVSVIAGLLLWGASGLAQDAPSTIVHGIAVQNIDKAINPGDDFYRYSNGAWLQRTEIPPDRASVNPFSVLDDISKKRVAEIVETVAKSEAPAGSNNRKIADLYRSFMDEAGIEAKGLTPIQAQLRQIRDIKDKRELARTLGETLRSDVDPLNNTNFQTLHLFGLWVAPGFSDSNHYTPYLLQGGLVMPDREYYLSDSQAMRELRTKYVAHVVAVLKLAGFSDPARRAQTIVDLEHALAEKHISLADDQDVLKANNTWKRADFTVKAPGLDWDEFFAGAGLQKQQSFIVWQPTAFTGESSLVASIPLETWKDWLAYHLIEEYSAVLPKPFADERFDFFGRAMSGVPQQRPRWQRGVNVVNALLGDAVGQLYVKQYFPAGSKQRAQVMVANIVEAFKKRIDALSWMAPATKAEAKAKLETLYVGVGYPESWRDYSALEIKPDDVFGNFWRSSLFEYQRDLRRLGSVVDKKEWCMTPQTVNAVNLPLQNALNFPAAILEPPFFSADAPDALNYGAIGAVIGHEVSHSFDTAGSTFDSQGRLRNWWTAADLQHFETATHKLALQYDSYKPFPDLAVNGQQTLAENIADVAGIAAALDGYHATLAGKPAPEQDGFSGDQQFFIAYGQAWGSKERDAALRQQVMTDSHAPAEYRADTVRNIDAWYADFGVKPGAKLYLSPEDRVRIW